LGEGLPQKTIALKPSTWKDLKNLSTDCEVPMYLIIDRLVSLANSMPRRWLTSTKDWEQVFTETLTEWLRMAPPELFSRLLQPQEIEHLMNRLREALEKGRQQTA